MLHSMRHGKPPKSKRVRDVTLIAAFRCNDGLVICADSQETLDLPLPDRGYAEYRVSVDKIEPLTLGHYDAVIGGAGHAALVDGFTETLTDEIATWPAGLSQSELKGRIRLIVLEYHRNEVAVCPAEDKDIHFLVCLKDSNTISDVHAWSIRTTAIKRIKTYAVIGWEEGIYRHDVDRHYKEHEKSLFSILVGIHLFLLAEQTSNNIGPPTKVVVATPIGFHALDSDEIRELDRRVSDLDSVIDRLRLRLCDTTIPLDKFSQDVSDFQDAIVNLRVTLTDNIVIARLARLKEIKTAEDLLRLYNPYLGLPTLEESTQALRSAWESVVLNRRSPRDLAIVSSRLAEATNIVVKMIRPAYDQGAITLEQRQEFGRRLSVIGNAGKAMLDEQRQLGGSIPDHKVTDIYSQLTNGVVEPLTGVANDFRKIFETAEPLVNEVIQGVHVAILSIFIGSFVAPFSKGPERLELEKEKGVES
jgi:hypothetical protein